MITYSEPEGPRGIVTATVEFPWPTNDTGQKVLRVMQAAAVEALTAAGTPTTARPVFADLRPAEGFGFTFLFTAPVSVPDLTQKEGP